MIERHRRQRSTADAAAGAQRPTDRPRAPCPFCDTCAKCPRRRGPRPPSLCSTVRGLQVTSQERMRAFAKSPAPSRPNEAEKNEWRPKSKSHQSRISSFLADRPTDQRRRPRQPLYSRPWSLTATSSLVSSVTSVSRLPIAISSSSSPLLHAVHTRRDRDDHVG